MANLNRFRINSVAVEQGEWVFPSKEEYDDLEIKTRGYTDKFNDARSALQRVAAKKYGSPDKIPAAVSRKINVDCLVEHVIQDVRGISDEDGNKIDFKHFVELLYHEDFHQLIVACFVAMGMVGQSKEEEILDAKKNSKKPSPSV